MIKAAYVLYLILLATVVGCSNTSIEKGKVQTGKLEHPVMRYTGVSLPTEGNVGEVNGHVSHVVENEGFIDAKTNDKIIKGSVVYIGKDAYLLVMCKQAKCVEFKPAPKPRWVKFSVD